MSPYSASTRRAVLAFFAASGFIALASEVVWSRLLVLYQGTSVYAFSAMLAVLLAGMAAGSYLGGRFLDRWRVALRSLAYVQMATGLAGLVALHLFDRGHCSSRTSPRGGTWACWCWHPCSCSGR